MFKKNAVILAKLELFNIGNYQNKDIVILDIRNAFNLLPHNAIL